MDLEFKAYQKFQGVKYDGKIFDIRVEAAIPDELYLIHFKCMSGTGNKGESILLERTYKRKYNQLQDFERRHNLAFKTLYNNAHNGTEIKYRIP